MRTLLLALTLAAATASPAAFADHHPIDAKNADKFPVPADATGGESQPGGGGKILMYKVARGRDTVVTEVKAALAKGGWKIEKDTKSPSGNAVRLEVKKGDKLYKVSFTGDTSQTALILTLP